MKKTLYDYKDIIKKLPIKDKYTKDKAVELKTYAKNSIGTCTRSLYFEL